MSKNQEIKSDNEEQKKLSIKERASNFLANPLSIIIAWGSILLLVITIIILFVSGVFVVEYKNDAWTIKPNTNQEETKSINSECMKNINELEYLIDSSLIYHVIPYQHELFQHKNKTEEEHNQIERVNFKILRLTEIRYSVLNDYKIECKKGNMTPDLNDLKAEIKSITDKIK